MLAPMPDRLPPLAALRAFHAAGTAGSMAAAAQQLGVTPSAISHQVRGLEARLGIALFLRTPRRLTPTPAGATLLAALDRGFGVIAAGVTAARDGTDPAKLRISTLPLFADTWLVPRLGRFRDRHPRIAIEIATPHALVDLERDGIDIAIRSGMELVVPPGHAALPLLSFHGLPVCAPALLPRLRAPADLAGETLIDVLGAPGAWADWLAAAGQPGLRPRGRLGFDTLPTALEAAAAGHGVALAIHPLVWAAPVAARLAAPFPDLALGTSNYVALHRPAAARPAVRQFLAWLRVEAARSS